MPTDSRRVGRDITADERRTAVLRATLECIAELSSEKVGMRDIARRAGVSVGLLQHHFASRDELIALAFRQSSEDILREWGEAFTGPLGPWERIVLLIDILVDREPLRQRCLVWLDFAGAAARHPETREQFSAVYEAWDRILRGAIVEGRRSKVFTPALSTNQIVEALLAQIDGGIMTIASGMDRMDGPHLRATTLALAGALLGHRPTPSPRRRATRHT